MARSTLNPAVPSSLTCRPAICCITSLGSKLNFPSTISVKLMLETSEVVKIVDATPKQYQSRWDVTMTKSNIDEVSAGAKPNSLVQRWKKNSVAQPAETNTSSSHDQTAGQELSRLPDMEGAHKPKSGLKNRRLSYC